MANDVGLKDRDDLKAFAISSGSAFKPQRSSVSCQARRSKPLAEVPEYARETGKLVSLAEVADPSCKSFLLRLLLV